MNNRGYFWLSQSSAIFQGHGDGLWKGTGTHSSVLMPRILGFGFFGFFFSGHLQHKSGGIPEPDVQKQPCNYYFFAPLSRNPMESYIYPVLTTRKTQRGGTSNRLRTGTTPGRWRRYSGRGAQKSSLQAAANRGKAGSAPGHPRACPGEPVQPR